MFWLVAPAVQAHFHPTFVNEINQGREKSSSKKECDVRRKEILNHVHDPLLKKLSADPDKWMTSSSIALLTLAVLKAGMFSVQIVIGFLELKINTMQVTARNLRILSRQ